MLETSAYKKISNSNNQDAKLIKHLHNVSMKSMFKFFKQTKKIDNSSNYVINDISPTKFVNTSAKLHPYDTKLVAKNLDKQVVQPYLNQQHDPMAKKITNYYNKLNNTKNKFIIKSNMNVNDMLETDAKTVENSIYADRNDYNGFDNTDKFVQKSIKNINKNVKIETKSINKLYNLGGLNKQVKPEDVLKQDKLRAQNKRKGLNEFHNINPNGSYSKALNKPLPHRASNVIRQMKVGYHRQINIYSSRNMEAKLNKLHLGPKLHRSNQISNHRNTSLNKQKAMVNNQNYNLANSHQHNNTHSVSNGFEMQ